MIVLWITEPKPILLPSFTPGLEDLQDKVHSALLVPSGSQASSGDLKHNRRKTHLKLTNRHTAKRTFFIQV